MKNNKGQMGAWEALIIVVLLISVGGLVWLIYRKPSDPSIYQANSKPKVTDLEIHPSFGGCSNVKVEEYMEGKKDAITNSAK